LSKQKFSAHQQMRYNERNFLETAIAHRRSETMIAIRGVDDGKTFSALPSEPLPQVQRAIPVAIVFLEEVSPQTDQRQHQVGIARRMRAARDVMPPLGMSVKELVEAGRER
jgi:hypothetical protein